MSVFTLTENQIKHSVIVDFYKRDITQTVYLVQYDRGLPVIEAVLQNNKNPYTLPNNATVNLKIKKKDGTYVYIPASGTDSERQKVYFVVTGQMTKFSGTYNYVIEIVDGNNTLQSSYLMLNVLRNPIQQDDIESNDDFKTLIEYLNDTEDLRDATEELKDQAGASARAAASSASASAASASAASEYADQAQNQANIAKTKANQASGYADDAYDSERAAKTSEQNANASKVAADGYSQTSQHYAEQAQQTAEHFAGIIPTDASGNNKLVTKTTLDDAVATNTANFYGTFSSYNALISSTKAKTNNDYALVEIYDENDPTVIDRYDRYKWSAVDNEWKFEFSLVNLILTSRQWEIINNGLTASEINAIITTSITNVINDTYTANSDV